MRYFIGIFVLFTAFPVLLAHAQLPTPSQKPDRAINVTTSVTSVKPKALIIRPSQKPQGNDKSGRFNMVNPNYVFSANKANVPEGSILPPALPLSKSRMITAPRIIGGVITPAAKPLVITPDSRERIKSSGNFDDQVIVRYTDNDVEDRMAGSRGEYIDVQRLPAQPHIRIRETNDSSPFQTASLPKADKESDQEPVIIFFKEKSSDLEVGQMEILEKDIFSILRRNGALKASVNGYADNEGGGKTPDQLSMSRALLISEYLVEKGIGSERIQARAMGQNTPISPRNRVDVIIHR